MSETSTAGIETWGSGRQSIRGRLSKQEIIQKISAELKTTKLDIYSLPISSLNKILGTVSKHQHLQLKLPEGRLKRPYLEELSSVLPNCDLTTLSVSALKSLTEALINA